MNDSSLAIEIDIVEAGTSRKSRNGHDGSENGVDESSTNGGVDITNSDLEAAGAALGGWQNSGATYKKSGVGTEGVLGLSHADRELVVALLLVDGDLLLGQLGVLDAVASVDLPDDGLDLLLDGEVLLVEVAEVEVGADGLVGASLHDGLRQLLGSLAALSPVVGHAGIKGPSLESSVSEHLDLLVGIGGESVDTDDAGNAELDDVLDVLLHVAQALGEELEVLLDVLLLESLAGLDLGAASVHLHGTNGGDEDDAVRSEAALSALDVEELLHANIGAEASLGDDVAVLADELEGDLISDDGGVAVGDVGEGTGVDEDGSSLDGLHEGGLDGLLHEDAEGASDAEVLSGDGLAGLGHANDHLAEAVPHVLEGGGEGEDGHDLGGDGDIKAGAADVAVLGGGQADVDLSQEAVAGIDDALPGDGLGVDVEADEAAALLGGELVGGGLVDAELLESLEEGSGEGLVLAVLVLGADASEEGVVGLGALVVHSGVDLGGEEVVGSNNGVDITGEVEVELLHGDDLGVATAGGTTLDAEGGALGGLSQAGEDLLVESGAESLGEADLWLEREGGEYGAGALALAEGSGVDAGDEDLHRG